MKALKRSLAISGAVVVLVLLVGFLLPAKYTIERDIVINAPIEMIYDNVNNPRKAETWNSWMRSDPTMMVSYNEIESGIGAKSAWKSKKSGSGSQEIVEVIPPIMTKTKLDFAGRGTATGYYKLREMANGVIVTNGFEGNNGFNIFARYISLGMNRMVGPHFENGLKVLKDNVESEYLLALEAQNAAKEAAMDMAISLE